MAQTKEEGRKDGRGDPERYGGGGKKRRTKMGS